MKINTIIEIFENDYANIESGIDNYGTYCDIRRRIKLAYESGKNHAKNKSSK